MLVFLDIDGVMVPAKAWQRPELLKDGFPAFSSKAVCALNKLIDTDTTIVLTTSHKARYTLEEWSSMFSSRGVVVHHIASLEDNVHHLSRKDEIVNWFSQHEVHEDFIIIDDDSSLQALPAPMKEHLLLTQSMIGLTEEQLAFAEALL
ncbi:MAG: hypothetical protein JNL13_06165 [Chitinophagaceae bacterium]|nr:hypothetical protein [Chitinophagaceae bacterium]